MAEHLRDLWDFEDAAASEKRFDEYLATVPASDAQERALVLTQKARTYGLRRQFDRARDILGQSHALLKTEDRKGQGWYEIEFGRVENSAGNPNQAREHFLKSLEIAEAENLEFLAIDAVHMLGIVDKGEASLEWNKKAIHMAEHAKDERARGWLGSLLNNTGWTYYDLGDFDKAMELFEKAVEFRKESGKQPNLRIACYCVAKCHRAMGHLEIALQQQLGLEQEALMAGDEPGYTFEEIGECLLALGRTEEARPYFARAFEILSKDEWLTSTEPERVERLRKLSSPLGAQKS